LGGRYWRYDKRVAVGRKPTTIRQSVAIPAPLAKEVRRIAKERHLTVGRALVVLAEKGVQVEREAQGNLALAYRRFLKAPATAKKDKAGKDLIRAIFGKDAIADDPIQ
jgi:predicted DNA-binding ribbon-helix-helix protein